MSRICDLTGKKPLSGHYVSHSNVKTNRKFYPNLQVKKFFVFLKQPVRELRVVQKFASVSLVKIGWMKKVEMGRVSTI